MIDKAPGHLQMPRAIALDNEALRILQMVGLEEGAFADRSPFPRVRYLSPYARGVRTHQLLRQPSTGIPSS